LGNSIYGSSVGSLDGVGTSGLGIDLYRLVVDNSLNPDSLVNDGPTLNDLSDTDTGPNNYINFPVINSAIQNSTALTVNFDLDAADSTDGNYRVEFFSNDAADSSGYGEGQTYLGATTVANGTAQEATLTLANGTDLTGKSITATTTAINNTTASGFGATSEFSEAIAALVTTPATTDTDNLADTGTSVWLYGAGILSILSVGVYLGFRRSNLGARI